METQFDTQSVWINYMTDNESSLKIMDFDTKIMSVLVHLDIKKYSTHLDKIVVVLVALEPISFPEKDRLIFRKKQNKIEIRINIDYEKLKNATEAETLQLIAEAYLAAISRFLSKRKDFDAKNFYIDVEKLFRENHFLV